MVRTGQQWDHSHKGFLSHYQMSPGSGGLMGNDGHNSQTPGTDVSDQPQQAVRVTDWETVGVVWRMGASHWPILVT